MSLLSEICLENFKCFDKLRVELSNLNVFSGVNSMGKSTVIQALLLLRQSWELGSLDSGIHLNGNMVSLGTGRDALYRDSDDNTISFAIGWKSGYVTETVRRPDKDGYVTETVRRPYKDGYVTETVRRPYVTETVRRSYKDGYVTETVYRPYRAGSYKWSFQYGAESDFLKRDKPSTNKKSLIWKANLFGDSFTYISADRIGPRRIYEKSYHEVVERRRIGARGENSADFLSEFGQSLSVSNKSVRHPKAGDSPLIYQTQAWLSEISPNVSINTRPYPEAGLVGMSYSKDTPLNVGFGLSYVMPVILSVLKAESGDLLILENPEAHLHPRGQRKMGELIAAACAGGVQIILETHSDHILNGIRLAVKRGQLKPEKVSLNYFYAEADKMGRPLRRKVSPQILPDGSLSSWPDGFFDEWDKAIDELF